jgi:hypothetical protein
MNLHGIVRGAIRTINPDIVIPLLRSAGYTTGADGKQVPAFTVLSGPAQVQATSGKDVERMNNLSIQGVMRTVYLYGKWSGIVRADKTGGDILNFPQMPGAPAQSWKVVNVKEQWPDWVCVIVVLQTVLVSP